MEHMAMRALRTKHFYPIQWLESLVSFQYLPNRSKIDSLRLSESPDQLKSVTVNKNIRKQCTACICTLNKIL